MSNDEMMKGHEPLRSTYTVEDVEPTKTEVCCSHLGFFETSY